MTRLIGLASPRNCQKSRDLIQAYREATANANLMEPPRDSGRPLLSLQEIDSRLVFAKCNPFTLGMPGRKWFVCPLQYINYFFFSYHQSSHHPQ